MLDKIKEWWEALLKWYHKKRIAASKNKVATKLESLEVRALWDIQEDHARGGSRRYGQVLRGKRVPGDRGRNLALALDLPKEIDWWVDEYEGPSGKGWILRAAVKQGPITSTLSIDSKKGSLGWVETNDRTVS